MEVYASEQEQVDALKQWWKENGRSVIAGVVLGLGGVFGWRAWSEHQLSVSEQASARFEQVLSAVRSADARLAIGQAQALINDYDSSAYADFAGLALARLKLQTGDPEAVETDLRRVLETSSDGGLRQIARVRLARVLAANGKLDEAWRLVTTETDASFAGEYAEIKGDISLARGDVAGARGFYQEALIRGVGNRSLVKMKIEDLSGSSATMGES